MEIHFDEAFINNMEEINDYEKSEKFKTFMVKFIMAACDLQNEDYMHVVANCLNYYGILKAGHNSRQNVNCFVIRQNKVINILRNNLALKTIIKNNKTGEFNFI